MSEVRKVRVRRRGLRLGSLFAGVGGFDVAAEALGIPVASWSEFDPATKVQVNQKVLSTRFPRAAAHGDVAGVTYASLGRPEVITGGSPCQGFSVAGLRAGMYDHRSGLFGEFARIVTEGVNDGNLKMAVWENVPGALSSNNGEDFANVIAAMIGSSFPVTLPKFKTRRARYAGVARGEMGFFAWRVLDARKFGVAQRRQRVFGVWSKNHDAIRVLFGDAGVERYLATAADVGDHYQGWVWFFDTDETPELGKMEADETVEVKLSQVLDWDADEKYYLSEKACLGILVRSSRRGRALPKILHYALWDQAGRPEEHTPDFPLEDDDGRFTLGLPVPFDWQASGSGDTSFRGKSRSFVVRKGDTSGTMQSNKVEAVAIPVCVTGEATHALKADGFDGSEDGTGRGQPIVPVLGFSVKDSGGDVGEEVSPTLRAMNFSGSHLNGGGQVGVTVPVLGVDPTPTHKDPHLVVAPFRKARRAHHVDDWETWEFADFANVVNEHDFGKDVRATDVVVVPTEVAGTLQGGDERRGYRVDAEGAASGHLLPVVGFSVDPAAGQGADLQARETDVSQALTANWLEKATDRGLRVVEPVLVKTNQTKSNGGNVSEGVSFSLRADEQPAAVLVPLTYRVRRLTPTECERLQGFPDGWTAIAGAKDSHRYRQMGNAVAVPVAAWVLARVKAVATGRPLPSLDEVLESLPWLRAQSKFEGGPQVLLRLPVPGPSADSNGSQGSSRSWRERSSKRVRALRTTESSSVSTSR